MNILRHHYGTLGFERALQVAYFRNLCKKIKGRYSCAIDSFLELYYRLFVPRIESQIRYNDLSRFFQLVIDNSAREVD